MNERYRNSPAIDLVRSQTKSVLETNPIGKWKTDVEELWDLNTPGMGFFVARTLTQLDFSVNGISHLVPEGSIVGNLSFLTRSPSKLENLWIALEGVIAFLDQVDENSTESSVLPNPTYIFGETNQEVAMLSRKLGFEVLGQADEDYFVVGTVDGLREGILSLAESNTDGKSLIERIAERREKVVKKRFDKLAEIRQTAEERYRSASVFLRNQ